MGVCGRRSGRGEPAVRGDGACSDGASRDWRSRVDRTVTFGGGRGGPPVPGLCRLGGVGSNDPATLSGRAVLDGDPRGGVELLVTPRRNPDDSTGGPPMNVHSPLADVCGDGKKPPGIVVLPNEALRVPVVLLFGEARFELARLALSS